MARIVMLVLMLAVVMVGVITLNARTAVAQDSAQVEEQGSVVRIFDHFIKKGGTITWFVLIPLSVATIALIVEHKLSLRQSVVAPTRTLKRIHSDLEAQRYNEAIRFVSKDPSMLAALVYGGLSQAGRGFEAIREAIAIAADDRAMRMLRRVEYLNVIGNVSPMVGLLGTVYGMIRLFASIGEAGGIPEPAVLASNISIALVTTFWGLLVAIPALVAFVLYRNRIDALTSDCISSAEKLLQAFRPVTGGESSSLGSKSEG